MDSYHTSIQNYIKIGQPLYHILYSDQKNIKRLMKTMACATQVDVSGRSITEQTESNSDGSSIMLIPLVHKMEKNLRKI